MEGEKQEMEGKKEGGEEASLLREEGAKRET